MFDAVSVQEFHEFLFEAAGAMVRALLGNVFHHGRDGRFADRKRAVAILPSEPPPVPSKPLSLMNLDDPPFSRFMASETVSVFGIRTST